MIVKGVLQTVNQSFPHGLAREDQTRVLTLVFLNTEMASFSKANNVMTEIVSTQMDVQTLGLSKMDSLALEALLFVDLTAEMDCFMLSMSNAMTTILFQETAALIVS